MTQIIKKQNKPEVELRFKPDIIQRAKEILEKENVLQFLINTIKNYHVGDDKIIATLILSMISPSLRKRENLLHVMTVGRSSKGKSSVMNHTSLISDRSFIVTSNSEKSVLYASKNGKIQEGDLIIMDEANADEVLIIERSLTDNSPKVATHWTVTDTKEFSELKMPSLIVFWRNSVDTPKDEQLLNRYLILNPDESVEQDVKVYEKIRDDNSFPIEDSFGKDFDLKVSKCVVEILLSEPVKIIIPYAKAIEYDNGNLSNRRSPKKFFSLLKCIVSLNRYQRMKVADHCIATIEDLETCIALWEEIGKAESVQVNQTKQKILNELMKGGKTAKELSLILGFQKSNIYNELYDLSERGLVTYEGYPKTYSLVTLSTLSGTFRPTFRSEKLIYEVKNLSSIRKTFWTSLSDFPLPPDSKGEPFLVKAINVTSPKMTGKPESVTGLSSINEASEGSGKYRKLILESDWKVLQVIDWDEKVIAWHQCAYPKGDGMCGCSPCNEYEGLYYCQEHFRKVQEDNNET